MAKDSGLAMAIYNHGPQFVRDWMVNVFSRRRGKAKFGPRFREVMNDLARTQWYDAETLAALQAEKLRRIVHYAHEFVPYYRELFDRLGLVPGDIRTPADLRLLPVLDKPVLQRQGERLRSRLYLDRQGVEVSKSSGTTGRPVRIWVDNDCLQIEKAFMWFHRSWAGIGPGDTLAAFLGFPVVPVRKTTPPFWVHDRPENRVMYSVHHLGRRNLPRYADSLASLRPRLVYGYPTAIALVAQYLNAEGRRDIRPDAVITSSETVLPHQRQQIEEAFGCRVMDWYGAAEMIANIVQCERGSYHVKQEYGVVEVLDDAGNPVGPGEEGTLVGTGLNNLAMPLIRYGVGDSVVPAAGTCPCGRQGPLVERVVGRVEDAVVTPDGRWLTRLDHVFKGVRGVEEAQLVQEAVHELKVRVVRTPAYTSRDEKEITANLRSRLGGGTRLVFDYVDAIPRTAGGKFRFVVSRVPGAGRAPDADTD